jgi:hypothetical protein
MQQVGSRIAFRPALLALAGLLGLLAVSASGQDLDAAAVAKAQQWDVYSVKFLCGAHREIAPTQLEGPVKPGNYLTAINVHNPNGGAMAFRKKAILMFREDQPVQEPERPIPPHGFKSVQLPPNWGLEIDCADIRQVLLNILPPPGSLPPPPAPLFIKGWVVIEVPAQAHQGGKPVPLDVTAVYTSHGFAGAAGATIPEGFSIDVEKITPTSVKK